jgi:uncharacterized protein (TIGR03067 family)
MRSKIGTVLVVVLWVAIPAWSDDDAKKELKKFEGVWTTVSSELDGTSLNELTKDLKFTIKGDTVAIEGNEAILKAYSKGTFKVDPDTKPKSIDFTVGGGDNKGNVVEGIYEFTNEDELKMCAKLVGKERPAKFETKEGTSTLLLVVKREKP